MSLSLKRTFRETYVLPEPGTRMREIQQIDATEEEAFMAAVKDVLDKYRADRDVAEGNRQEAKIKKQVSEFVAGIALEGKKQDDIVILPRSGDLRSPPSDDRRFYGPTDANRWVVFSRKDVSYDEPIFQICPTILCSRTHDDRWTIAGVVTKVDYGQSIEVRYFRATHPVLGEVYGDVEQYIVASSQVAYDVFIGAHPFTEFYKKRN